MEGYDHDSVYARYKKQVPTNLDITAARNESLFSLPGWMKEKIMPMITEEKDYIAAELVVNISILVPLHLLTFLFCSSHLVMLVFLVARLLLFGTRFFLTLHQTSHHKLWKKEYWYMNSYLELVIAPLMGMPPGTYYVHHVMMHHIENNVFPYDVSSTMPHQRDSWPALGMYIFKYFTAALIYLPYYAFKRGRVQLVVYIATAWLLYFGGATTMYAFNPVWTTWLFINYAVVGCLLMKGNFAQHMFIDPSDPFSNYKLAFNCINHKHNLMTYNDGYHIIHHANSRLHWREMPLYFEKNIEKFAQNDALVFNDINNDKVFGLVFSGNWAGLYSHWVQLTPKERTLEEFTELCKIRLEPNHSTKKSK